MRLRPLSTTIFASCLLAASLALALPADASTSAPAGSACAKGVLRPFVPTRITMPHIIKRAKVLAVARERNSRVPGTPPLTVAGKHQFAWDAPGVEPGARRGTAIFDAHTWPDGSALGNAMSRKLRVGAVIRVFGKDRLLCYRVTRQVSINVSQPDPKGFYSSHGTPRIAFVVCSGRRLGPGDWTRRTYWFARPYLAAAKSKPPVTPTRTPKPAPAPNSGGVLGSLLGGIFG